MSKELKCRLVRNTVTSMVSLLRASQGQMERYPSKTEITAMAKKVVEYYPMLQDNDASVKHVSSCICVSYINHFVLFRGHDIYVFSPGEH